MSQLVWAVPGTRLFEAGVDRGVLYIDSDAGIPWIGLISVDENPSGGEPQAYYIDGEKYLNISSDEEFEATVKAFTYPVEFSDCDGTARIRDGLFFGQQPRKSFGFSYRTMIGNEINGVDYAYKIHLVYGALASPSTKSVSTFSDSPEAADFSWDLTTKAPKVSGYKSTAHIVVDSRYTNSVALAAVEALLYGSDDNIPRLPTAAELIDIFDTPLEWSVTDLTGGKFRVSGPDANVNDIGLDIFTLTHPSVTVIDADSFTITY